LDFPYYLSIPILKWTWNSAKISIGTNVWGVIDLFTNLTTIEQLQARFHSEEVCAEYLINRKWPTGFICPRCSHTTAFRIDTRRLPLYQCVHCHYQASPTVGTIMESSSTDLRKWFTAMFLVSATDSGINALRLGQLLHVTYKTAWLMLRKIRLSITQADDAVKLTGTVYIDEAKCGKPYTGPFYYEADEFPVLVGAATDDQDQPAYVKIQMLPKSHYNDTYIVPEGIRSFREKNVELEAAVTCTMGTRTYRKNMKGYPIFVQARAWIKKTFHGLGQRHLQHYWNEFCWRINARLQNKSLFESMLDLCAAIPTTTYTELKQM
jgi:transposase-like protein